MVIDDDLGRSGATIENRLGFQRLVAEVGLENVGLILGVEMSRLAGEASANELASLCRSAVENARAIGRVGALLDAG